MPTYQYRCADGHQVEVVQAFTDDPLRECPDCGALLRKVYGSVGVVFKGSGFYRNDSRDTKSSEIKAATKSETNSASKSSSDASGSSDSGSSASKSDGVSSKSSGDKSSSPSKPAASSSPSTSSSGSAA